MNQSVMAMYFDLGVGYRFWWWEIPPQRRGYSSGREVFYKATGTIS